MSPLHIEPSRIAHDIAREARYRNWKKQRDKLGMPSSKHDYNDFLKEEIKKEATQLKNQVFKSFKGL